MLLLIALANVHLYVYGHELGIRGYPRDLDGVDRVVVAAQLMLVDGRAYPLFGLLFGYGVVQLARRRVVVGGAGVVVTTLLYAGSGLTPPGSGESFLPSMAIDNAAMAAATRVPEWV